MRVIYGSFAPLKHTHFTGCAKGIVPNNDDLNERCFCPTTDIGSGYQMKFWGNTLDTPILIGSLAWNEIRRRVFGKCQNTKNCDDFAVLQLSQTTGVLFVSAIRKPREYEILLLLVCSFELVVLLLAGVFRSGKLSRGHVK